MLALAQSKAASVRPTSMVPGADPCKTTSPAATNSQWSRNSRYTLKIPLIANEVSSGQTIRQVETFLYIPSHSYRSFGDMEQEACNAIFGVLYGRGERTNFDIYTQLELVCQLRRSQDSGAGSVSPTRRKMPLEEHNWEEMMDMILSGKADKVEVRADWWRSRKSGGVSRNTGQTPSNFAPKISMEQMSNVPAKGKGKSVSPKSVSPRRSETSSGRSSRSGGTVLGETPKGRADSGALLQPLLKE